MPQEVLPFNDEPVKYKVGEKYVAATDDALVKMLVRKFGSGPEDAVALAEQERKQSPEGGTLEREAMNLVAERERRRIQLMDRYMKAKSAILDGKEVSPEDQKYVEAWDARRAELIRRQAMQAGETKRLDEQRAAEPQEHPVARTARAAIIKLGLDPNSAAQFAQQLHGMPPAPTFPGEITPNTDMQAYRANAEAYWQSPEGIAMKQRQLAMRPPTSARTGY